jgi:hypothetical protein
MPAYWLTYKPLGPTAPLGWPSEKLTALVERFNLDPLGTTEWWRVANKSTRVGEKVFLFKQGDGARGIFGVGTVVSPTEMSAKLEDDEKMRPRAEIRFDALVDPEKDFLLSWAEIQDLIPPQLANQQSSGTVLADEIRDELDARIGPITIALPSSLGDELSDNGSFDPDSFGDDRERAMRSICLRRGQAAFRSSLLEAYDSRCVITGCAVRDVLDAAHVFPYRGTATNHVSNGLLLRTDLHTLFDCDLIGFDPAYRSVVVSEGLAGSSYAKLAGHRLRQPSVASNSPNRTYLEHRYKLFQGFERKRLALRAE